MKTNLTYIRLYTFTPNFLILLGTVNNITNKGDKANEAYLGDINIFNDFYFKKQSHDYTNKTLLLIFPYLNRYIYLHLTDLTQLRHRNIYPV